MPKILTEILPDGKEKVWEKRYRYFFLILMVKPSVFMGSLVFWMKVVHQVQVLHLFDMVVLS